jgi:hypothetical protein
MYAMLQLNLFDNWESLGSTESPAASLANPTQSSARKRLRKTSGTYGLRFGESFAKFSPDGRCWKTSLDCYLPNLENFSREFCETWTSWGSMSNGELYHAPIWKQALAEVKKKDSALEWEEPTFEREYGLLPTPTAGLSRGGSVAEAKNRRKYSLLNLTTKDTTLNPYFVAAMMGYPPTWADISCDTQTLMGGSPHPQCPVLQGSLVARLNFLQEKLKPYHQQIEESMINSSEPTTKNLIDKLSALKERAQANIKNSSKSLTKL